MSKMKGAAVLVEMLERYGVRSFFFMSGGPTRIFSEMSERTPQIRQVLTHSEKAAAYMADGYSRASYRPGVCFGQVGPGASNLAAGVAEAYLASTPLVALTGVRQPEVLNRNAYQELEQMRFFDAVTKWNVLVSRTTRIPDVIRGAFRVATSGRPRPVHVGLQVDAVDADADFADLSADKENSHYPPRRIIPDLSAVKDALALLKVARRPVIVAGGGAVVSQAWGEVTTLAEQASVPVTTTLSGKGAISEDHPLSVGVMGRYSRRCANDIVKESDMVFYVGCKVGNLSTDGWTLPPKGTKIVQVDIEATEIGRNYPVEVGILGDAKTTLSMMLSMGASGGAHSRAQWVGLSKRRVKAWKEAALKLMQSSKVPVSAYRVVHELQKALGKDGVVVADTGYAAAWGGVLYSTRQGRNFYRSAGSLGWAFPGSLGVKLALPDRQVVCLTGDGGFGYHLTELETSVRHGAPVVVVVLNNGTLAFERHDFKFFLGGKGYEASDYLDTNFAAIARAFGCAGVKVKAPGDIGGTIDGALRSGKTTVVDVATDPEELGPVTDYQEYVPKAV
ncbi:MAG: thiamine pyrophosphate-binding protein [Thaumarchaeota archaeon]|nr:thiamine pyrophosphate-binding protein [Nitrososphaerota archaeon]